MTIAISSLFLAALIASSFIILRGIADLIPHAKELRLTLAEPEKGGHVRVTAYPRPALRGVVSRGPLRVFARRFGRHHDPKPVTHRLHRFEQLHGAA